MYTVTTATASKPTVNGDGIIPIITPEPLAHIAIALQRREWHVLQVHAGRVVEVCSSTERRDYICGFAAGFAQARNLPVHYALLDSASIRTAALDYAELWTTVGASIEVELRAQMQRMEESICPEIR
jgi:hypothetical protein